MVFTLLWNGLVQFEGFVHIYLNVKMVFFLVVSYILSIVLQLYSKKKSKIIIFVLVFINKNSL